MKCVPFYTQNVYILEAVPKLQFWNKLTNEIYFALRDIAVSSRFKNGELVMGPFKP
jgi:hypothetical protein